MVLFGFVSVTLCLIILTFPFHQSHPSRLNYVNYVVKDYRWYVNSSFLHLFPTRLILLLFPSSSSTILPLPPLPSCPDIYVGGGHPIAASARYKIGYVKDLENVQKVRFSLFLPLVHPGLKLKVSYHNNTRHYCYRPLGCCTP